jgi:hypothetical protein
MATVNKKISFFIIKNLNGEEYGLKLLTNYFGEKQFGIGGKARRY